MTISYDDIRMRGYDFNRELEDRFYRNWIGVLDEINLPELFDRYQEIFGVEALAAVRERQPASAEEDRRDRHLLGMLFTAHIDYQTRHLSETIIQAESKASVEWRGTPLPYRSISPAMIRARSRQERLALHDLAVKVRMEQLNPLRANVAVKTFEIVRSFGFTNYVELCGFVQRRDFNQLAAQLAPFLSRSEDVYFNYLDEFLTKYAGIGRREATVPDLASLRRVPDYDGHFPKNNLLQVLRETWAGLGFPLEQTNIQLDLDNRPNKIARPCVSAVDMPVDVRLTICPTGGYSDYVDLFHESGHAQHFVHVQPGLDFEYKYWGDRGFTEGMAYLFQHVTYNPDWLNKKMNFQDHRGFRKFNALTNLHHLRRLVSKFLYEKGLFEAESVKGAPARFSEVMSRGTGVYYTPDTYLDMDSELYAAGYSRARLFECQLRLHLEQRFGMDWWRKPACGDLLRDLWRDGRRNRAEDVLAELGLGGFDPDLYLEVNLAQLREGD